MIAAADLESNRKAIASELTVQSLLNSIYASYLVVDVDLNVMYFNHHFASLNKKYFGKDVRVGMNMFFAISTNKTEVLKRYAEAALSGKCIEVEIPLINDKGIEDWFFLRLNALIDEDGDCTGLCLYLAEINKRKQTELALKESNERYEFVTKITSDAIWDWNIETNRLLWSEGYETSFGHKRCSEEEAMAEWKERLHPDDRKRTLDKFSAALSDPNACYWEDEYRYMKSDGSYAFIYDRGHIIYDRNRPVRMVGAMSDITGRKLFELEREQMTNELIQRNKDLEQFAFIISHNLRSQIANVLGLSDLIHSNLLPPDDKEMIFSQIHASVLKLDEVVKDINHILHIKRNISEKKEVVYLKQLFDDVIEGQQLILDDLDCRIDTDFSEVPAIYALKSYMNSIFFNLVSNSIKYRKSEGPLVITASSKIDFNKIYLRFEDNGLGIDLNTNGKQLFGLYKRFHQDKEGKGMGLYMVKTQVEAQGGKIEALSEPGEGTCFIISFNKDIAVSLH